jgi:hypothetical protein
MVVHVVLFRPRGDIAESEKRAMMEAVATAAARVPSVRRFVVGSRVTHGAAYERLTPPDFPYVAIAEFDDLEGLQAYLHHPEHEKLGELFYRLQDAALAYDYEVRPANAEMSD